MSKNKRFYVVTEWWTNGECYEDWSESEKPVKVHSSLDDLVDYWKNKINTFELVNTPNTYNVNNHPIYKFMPQKEDITPFECPYDSRPYACGHMCKYSYDDNESFNACMVFEDSQDDGDYTEYKVYLVD